MTDSITVPILDKTIGGILPGLAYFFHGGQGTGKTVLGIQIALSWARTGKKTLFLTSETPADLIEHSEFLGMSLRDHCETGEVIIGHLTPNAPNQLASLGADGLIHRFMQTDQSNQDNPISSVVIDSAETLFSGVTDRKRQRAMVSKLVDGLRDQGWNTIFLADNKLMTERPGIAEALRDRCWATVAMGPDPDPLSFWKWWKGARREETLSLRVEKSRQSTPFGHRIPYRISADVGLIPAWEHEASIKPIGSTDGAGKKPRVLLASEDKELFNPLEALLKRSTETRFVSSGVDALAQAVTWNPQVIVAEIDMPDLSGISVVRALRQGHYVMPVILISRKKRRQSERIRAYLNGATDFVFYPTDPVEMVYRIAVACRMQLSIFNDSTEERMLDVLIRRAESHVLDRPSFLHALSLSLTNSTHLSSPVTLIGFRLIAESGAEVDREVWKAFRQTLDTYTRSGDLITGLDDHSVAVLLCHELRQGAASYLARMKRFMEKENVGHFVDQVDWAVESSIQTIQLSSETEIDPQGLLSGIFANPTLFISSSVHRKKIEESERKGA